MSDSLFLDPFQVPAEQPAGTGVESGRDPSAKPAEETEETIAGTVVDSAPASSRAGYSVAVDVPLDLVDAASAFLDDPHLWWPRDHKATDSGGHLYFADGELQEEGTDGDIHRWASVMGAVDGILELSWMGRRSLPGTESGPGEGPRLHLSWTAGPEGGTRITVRGTSDGAWREDWERILGGFARYAGGGPVEQAVGETGE